MLIALLALLGVNLIVIVVLLAGVLSRKRWISHQPGAFKGAIGVVDGEVHGLSVKWKRGYGRWVQDVLVWTKAPFLFRNELVVAASLTAGPRPTKPGEVRRLGKHPTVLTVAVEDEARIELASADEPDRARAVRLDHGQWCRSGDEQPPINRPTGVLTVLKPGRLEECVVDRRRLTNAGRYLPPWTDTSVPVRLQTH